MKVSINLKLVKSGDDFGWISVLKFKATNKKILSPTHFGDPVDAMVDATTSSLNAIKTQCTIDVFANNIGNSSLLKIYLDKAEEIKKQYPNHIIKIYAS